MPVSAFHREVATVALRAAAAHGFALAGGNALLAHGLVDRVTHDIDLFTDRPRGVRTAAGTVESALRAAGFQVVPVDRYGGLVEVFEGIEDGLMEWEVTGPGGERTELQLAHVDRSRKLVTMDIGPVLDIEDVVGGKVCAAAGRAEVRDLIDVAAALGRWSVGELISFARRLDPGLTQQDFADTGRRLDRLPDRAFAGYHLTPAGVAELRERMAAWPRS